MPTIKISYEDIRQEAKDLLKNLKKTDTKAKLTQAQTLVANKYNCKNLGLLRSKTEKNNGYLRMELTDKIVLESMDKIKQLFEVEPFNDNGISCVTVYATNRKDTSGKTVRLEDKTVENLLDDKNTILALHEHFKYVIGEDYLDLVCRVLSSGYFLHENNGRVDFQKEKLLSMYKEFIMRNINDFISVSSDNEKYFRNIAIELIDFVFDSLKRIDDIKIKDDSFAEVVVFFNNTDKLLELFYYQHQMKLVDFPSTLKHFEKDIHNLINKNNTINSNQLKSNESTLSSFYAMLMYGVQYWHFVRFMINDFKDSEIINELENINLLLELNTEQIFNHIKKISSSKKEQVKSYDDISNILGFATYDSLREHLTDFKLIKIDANKIANLRAFGLIVKPKKNEIKNFETIKFTLNENHKNTDMDIDLVLKKIKESDYKNKDEVMRILKNLNNI